LSAHNQRLGAESVAYAVPTPAFSATVERLLAAWESFPDVPGPELGAAIAGAAHAHELARTESGTALVISGPESEHLHARSTEQVLIELIDSAKRELLLITFALCMYPELKSALAAALGREGSVTVLAEDPADNPGFTGNPAQALVGLAVTRLRWTRDQRPKNTSLHAKVAVADRKRILITSANLTNKGTNDNLEVGLEINDGALGERICRHVASLVTAGVFQQDRTS
jgi:cardiolipin synthase A/B